MTRVGSCDHARVVNDDGTAGRRTVRGENDVEVALAGLALSEHKTTGDDVTPGEAQGRYQLQTCPLLSQTRAHLPARKVVVRELRRALPDRSRFTFYLVHADDTQIMVNGQAMQST